MFFSWEGIRLKNDHSEAMNIDIQQEAPLNTGGGEGLLGALEKTGKAINIAFAWLAGISLLLMVALVVANTLLRTFLVPIQGTSEIVGWLGAISVAFALGYTQLEKGHVMIDLLVQKFPRVLQRYLELLVSLVNTLFSALISWQLIKYGINVMNTVQLSQTLQLAFYPLIFAVSVGFMGLTFVFLVEFLKNLTGRGAL